MIICSHKNLVTLIYMKTYGAGKSKTWQMTDIQIDPYEALCWCYKILKSKMPHKNWFDPLSRYQRAIVPLIELAFLITDWWLFLMPIWMVVHVLVHVYVGWQSCLLAVMKWYKCKFIEVLSGFHCFEVVKIVFWFLQKKVCQYRVVGWQN